MWILHPFNDFYIYFIILEDSMKNGKRYVLVVDDNLVNRCLLSKILSDTYVVLEAENGRVALDILEKYGDSISIILLDLVMPVMNGYEFLEKQQSIPVLKSIPVIITTQKDTDSDEIEALSKGASDFLTKPYNATIIKHRVANIIKIRETAAFVKVVEHDALTGLYNKEAFYERVGQILGSKSSEDKFDIICIDVENFKLFNDMFGEEEGDKFLCKISDAIKSNLTDCQALASRITGDIFVVLIPSGDGQEKEFVKAVQEHIQGYTSKFNVILRFGIYEIVDEDVSVRAMCDRAKLASQTIKGIYDRYYVYYDDEIRNTLMHQQELTGSMAEALNNDQFKVFYQPKFSLDKEELIGGEALIRWQHPDKGFMPPDEFIPLFEKNGFITSIDLYVFETTCKLVSKWQKLGYRIVPISVNISRVDIYNNDLPSILNRIIEKYDIDRKYIHLEITETAYTDNPRQLIDAVKTFKDNGFVLEMDDFGSGYSSLNMLSDVPVDMLKLDMKFLQSDSDKNKDILNFIVGLAEKLNLSVIAEGIETKVELNFLRKIGCKYGQGYYFSKPLPIEEFEKIIEKFSK